MPLPWWHQDQHLFNYATSKGMKNQDELIRRRAEEMKKHPMKGLEGAAESGWGNARKDLTWVKDNMLEKLPY